MMGIFSPRNTVKVVPAIPFKDLFNCHYRKQIISRITQGYLISNPNFPVNM